jgi:hypothetical protein
MAMTSKAINQLDEYQTLPDVAPIAKTFVDDRYARPIHEPLVRKLLREWDERALGTIMLSLRPDGWFAIIDGQHRIEAAKRMHMTELPARIYIDLTVEEEARLYRLFAVRKQQSTMDRFRAGIVEGDPGLLRIRRIVEALGMRVQSGHYGEGSLAAVGTLARVYARYGPDMLDLVLRTLYAAFGRDSRAYSHAMLNGLAAFIVRYEEHCDWVRLVRRMKEEGLQEINQRLFAIKRAFRNPGSSDPIVGQIIVDIYNKHLTANRLMPWESGRTMANAQRHAVIPPAVRLSQRKALADVPNIRTPEAAS